MARHNKPQAAKSSVLRERLAYRLWSSSSHPQHTAKTNDASSPAKETTTTTTTICDSRVRGTLEELAKVNDQATIFLQGLQFHHTAAEFMSRRRRRRRR
jgi:hypothetical protein